MMDPRFLRDVQTAGWNISEVDDHNVLAKCPRFGCELKVLLNPAKPIPATRKTDADLAEIAVPSFNAALEFLMDRRNELGLNQAELEECIGLTKDHLAKVESEVRIPNIMTFIEWAQGLGYGVYLRPIGLPPLTLSTIAQTRDKAKIRKAKALRQRSRGALPAP